MGYGEGEGRWEEQRGPPELHSLYPVNALRIHIGRFWHHNIWPSHISKSFTIPTSFLVYTSDFFTLPVVLLLSFPSGVETLEKGLGWRVSRSSRAWFLLGVKVLCLSPCELFVLTHHTANQEEQLRRAGRLSLAVSQVDRWARELYLPVGQRRWGEREIELPGRETDGWKDIVT